MRNTLREKTLESAGTRFENFQERKWKYMICGRYYLGLDHCDEVEEIRRRVFGEEQGIEEFAVMDEIDEEAVHAVVYTDADRTDAVGTGRLYRLENTNDYKIGRIAVLKSARGNGYGDFIVRLLADKGFLMGADRIIVGAQSHAISFYEKIGFKKTGVEYTEAGVCHTVMELLQNQICKACQQKK